jgi:Pectate lyase superfamily protein
MMLSMSSRFLQPFLMVSLIVLIGCAGPQATPTLEPATATEKITASPGQTAQPTATPQPTTPVEATQIPTAAPAAEIVLIKNAALGTYLYEADGKANLAALTEPGTAFQWIIEDYQGSKRLQNVATGNYMAIENLKDYVETLSIQPEWMSPRWTFNGDPASGAIVIRNVWHNWEVLYVEADGAVTYGRPPAEAALSEWAIESLTGSALAAITPTAVVAMPTASQPEHSRGAAVPWIEYEAEDGQFSGSLLGPDRTFGTIASEASGRVAVQLADTGDYTEFTTTAAASSIVVRYVIPDSVEGDGINASLSLYVDGAFQQKLNLTSKYAWSYGGEAAAYNAPAPGEHHFFDEVRALIDEVPAGATVRLQKDADDTADYYVVDLVDLELVDAPKTMPQGFLSIVTDCGAVPDDEQDDGAAIQDCINLGRAEGKGVWIPVGTFESTSAPFEVSEVTIRGAGMWYSTLHGFYARFNCMGNYCRYYDFAILGETVDRDDSSPDNGFNNGAGTGSWLENIWLEHTKVGYWVGPGTSNGLVILNSRFRNLFADGVNFASGTSNSVIENSHFRNTGDDALASWSLAGDGPVNTNNVFRFNTVQIPWRANCFAIYGGQDNKIENNLCYDVVTYPGILIAQSFNSAPFAGTTVVQHTSLIRAGGPMYNNEHGALKIWSEQGPITGLVVRDMLIEGSTFSGIELYGSYPITSATIEQVDIQNAGTVGIFLRSGLAGELTVSFVTVTNPAKEALLDYSAKLKFKLVKAGGNTGW